ncbi:type III-A CRISPR-associated protein Cas10/Csm1 [Archaeoglobales archaeon]|mgnify:CR=1 FL=1|nr:MAG: type III-A CRISPR-associated protein Cas10/Csm1 [Archaeoglobales archaeon]
MKIEEKVVLAALLHDIGKIEERYSGKSNHAVLTKEFLKEFDDELAELAYGHHSGRDFNTLDDVRSHLRSYAEIICKADNISAGLERMKITAEALKNWARRDRRDRPMLSVLSTVNLDKGDSEAKYFIVRELTLEPFYLKAKQLEKAGVDYAFWPKMKEEVKKVLESGYNFEKLLFTISNILKKYLFFVPADTYERDGKIPIPDTSLYEHMRLSSIFALALLKNREKFVLIRGDISGIQDFIAKITSKKALKFLKGRSFFLELLNVAAAFRICRDLRIPPTQILSATAGNFAIIAPVSENYEKILERTKREINKELIDSGIYIAMAWKEFDYDAAQDFSSLMEDVGKDLDSLKLRRYHELIEDEYETVFGLDRLTEGKLQKECDVCRAEVDEGNLKTIEIPRDVEETEKLEVCGRCYDIYTLSDKLVKIGRLVNEAKGRGFYIGIYQNGGGDIDLLGIGFSVEALPCNLIGADYVFVANTVDFLEDEFIRNGIGCGFRFFNVNVAETSIDKLSNSSHGAKYIGILKMDGDDMGKVFSTGIKEWWKKLGISQEIKMSPGRYATLSSLLEIFFGYCVDRICREGKFFTRSGFAEKPDIYVVFSGGDDLFVVGPWNQIVDLAIKINDEYFAFTGNPNMTISAGITIVERKFPIYKSYLMTLESLENAKTAYREKSAISLFDRRIKFVDIQEARKIKDFLVSRIREGTLSRAIIYALFNSLSNGGKYRRKWAAKYVIARYQERFGDLNFLNEKIDEVFRENSFSKILVALKWAELLTRGEEDEKSKL